MGDTTDVCMAWERDLRQWPPDRRAQLMEIADALCAAGWGRRTAEYLAHQRMTEGDAGPKREPEGQPS